jgi:histidine ammonia-lyase
MGTVAARKAFRSVSNAKHVVALEVLADLQALSFRNADRLGTGAGRIYAILKQGFAVYDNTPVFHDDLPVYRRRALRHSPFHRCANALQLLSGSKPLTRTASRKGATGMLT